MHGCHFDLLYVDCRNKLGTCVTGPWQWPYRGVRVGEASHPGPILVSGDEFPGAACVEFDNDATQETEGGVLTPMEVHHGPDVEC